MESLSWERLEPAAEATIAAAASAMLWCGEDRDGVLAHMGATTSRRIVSSRIFISAVSDEDSSYAAEFALDLFFRSREFEPAALPASVVPHWAATVREAISDAKRRCLEAACWGGPALIDVAAETTKLWALTMTSMWGEDPLPVDAIETMARAITKQGFRVPL
jgi:hypothetical protein